MERYPCLKKDLENCNHTAKKNIVFHHENIAYKKKNPLPEWALSLHYMLNVLPITHDRHLRHILYVIESVLFCLIGKEIGVKVPVFGPAGPDIDLHRLMFLSIYHLVFWISIPFLNLMNFIIWQSFHDFFVTCMIIKFLWFWLLW